MKKLSLTIILIVSLFQFSFAQTNTFPTTGSVGIGTVSPIASLTVIPSYGSLTNSPTTLLAGSTGVLGTSAGAYLYPFEFQNNAGNIDRFQIAPYRRVAGASNWYGTAYRLQFAVDESFTDGSMAYIEVGASDPNVSGGGFISLGTSGSDRLCITSTGGVGIGTTNTKGYLLAVNGSTIATSVVVKAYANWPDYVFRPNYQLASLTDVKTYIDQNHHLPELPSEADIKKDGLNLGEMNKLLVKKVEELTLYLIEEDKKNKEQEARIKALESKLNKLLATGH